jgi:aryl-alcohol dehydrogenase-like predicted oxidoreductase
MSTVTGMQSTTVEAAASVLGASAIGLGCSRLGSTLGGTRGADAVRLLHHALDSGVTVFDTANIYGQGESERLLGRAFRGRRDRVVLVTKAGQRFTAMQRSVALVKAPLRHLAALSPALRRSVASRRAAPLPRDYSAAHLRQSIEASLRRLGTDRIDLFLLHSPSAEDIRQGEGFAMLDGLRRAGTLGGWGISCDDAPALRAALQVPEVAALQIPLQVAALLRPELAAAAQRGVTLFMRELFAGRPHDTASRRAAVTAALACPGAKALIGTTSTAHLDEALGFVTTAGWSR